MNVDKWGNDFLRGYWSKVAGRNVGKDFGAGIDPTGVVTYGYGIADAPKSKATARKRRLLGTAGGMVGGALIVPSALSGLMGAGKGLIRLRREGLAGLGRHTLTGLKRPLVEPVRAWLARRSLAQMAAGKTLGSSAKARLLDLVGQGLKDVNPIIGKRLGKLWAKASPATRFGLLSSAEPKAYAGASTMLSRRVNQAASFMGLGGLVNAGSAYYQYGQGRRLGKMLTPAQRAKLVGENVG